jgi:site-specific recombinase XerD
MTDLIVVPKATEWPRLKALVLDSVSSPITQRVYNLGLDEFFAWFSQEPRPGFTKATVSAWRVALEARGLGYVSINVRITAVRKLAAEAADNGLLAPELAAGIARVKSAKSMGVRMGNWLSLKQAQALLNAPDITTTKGLRDRAIIAVLLGCGLRRSEVAALTMGHIQQRDGRWCIVDLFGKHGRVGTVPAPAWVKVAIDAWTGPAGVVDGHVFRPVNRADQVAGEVLSEKVVWQMLRPYAAAAGVPGIAPHDCRRTAAKLCRVAGGELEQIQLLLGHASVKTTERYLGTKQDLVHAPNDGIRLRVVVKPSGRAGSPLLARQGALNAGHCRAARPQVRDSSWLMPESATLSRPEAPCRDVWLRVGCVGHRHLPARHREPCRLTTDHRLPVFSADASETALLCNAPPRAGKYLWISCRRG